MSALRARVDADKCIACGLCIEVCPAVFEAEDDGRAVVRIAAVPPEEDDACRNAAAQCPVEAIILEESGD